MGADPRFLWLDHLEAGDDAGAQRVWEAARDALTPGDWLGFAIRAGSLRYGADLSIRTDSDLW